jgi:NADH-quinone oxidoreductase subunit G
MGKQITLKIDGRPVCVPEGMLIVDAAKQAGIIIPVFCHHPKLEPVGMCRMCLVDIGRPQVDRATGAPVLNDDGTPKIGFGPKLETACTTPVSEGMVVWGVTEKVMAARKDVLEFLLTSHPLDCPVCDKGGECPLQNQTMAFGPATSRFILDEKNHAAKHLPLGELIYLDRERCIQCARCVRFQDQVVDDPVIGFYQRGRNLEINTLSEPGFDSIFSGNTADICPVGALTTTDFHFGARPWELTHKSSICSQCPVGCNLTYDVRREAKSNGKTVIKRVMPRQNEEVNEIWLCDKGRFTYTHAESPERLHQPLLRKDGELIPVSWKEALSAASEKIRAAGNRLVTLASGRLTNEDLFAAKTFAGATNSKLALYSNMGGGEWVTRVGLSAGSNLSELKKGSVILVIGCDLHQEAPLWWLRVKQAAQRGATLIVANARKTRLDKFASFQRRYYYGEEVETLHSVFKEDKETAELLTNAENLVIIYGSDGMGLTHTSALAEACAEHLVKTNHFGRANNGLIPVWQHANDQGAAELGILPDADLVNTINNAMGLYLIGVDPVGDDPLLKDAVQRAGFVIVQELFLTETAKLADVVFPAQAAVERSGTYVSGERRAQYFGAAVPALDGTKPDFAILSEVLEGISQPALPTTDKELFALAFPVIELAKLREVKEQLPAIGGRDASYGGTGSKNTFGLGVHLPLVSSQQVPARSAAPVKTKLNTGDFLAVPITCLYDHGQFMDHAPLLEKRIVPGGIAIHPAQALKLGITDGRTLKIKLNGEEFSSVVKINPEQPEDVLLVARSCEIPTTSPTGVAILASESIKERGAL